MRTFPLITFVVLFFSVSTEAQIAPTVIGTDAANSPAKLTLESRMDYVDTEHNVTPFAIRVKSTFDLNLQISSKWPMIFTGAGAVTHTLLDVSGLASILPKQCTVSLTPVDGSIVARIHYTSGGDPVLELGNLGSIQETLSLGGLCAVANPPRSMWGGPYSVLHEAEMSDSNYYQFAITHWTQIGPSTSDGPVTFLKDYVQSTSTIGNDPIVPLAPVNEVREVTHVEFTIYARSPVTDPSPVRRRAVHH